MVSHNFPTGLFSNDNRLNATMSSSLEKRFDTASNLMTRAVHGFGP